MKGKPDKGDEDIGGVVRGATRGIFACPDAATPKLVAWAYGCSRAGSEDEARLLALLRAKLSGEPEVVQASIPRPPSSSPQRPSKPQEDDPF